MNHISAFQLEYLWIDGGAKSRNHPDRDPTPKLRSKTKIEWCDALPSPGTAVLPLGDNHFPEWNFDGSSTNQATTEESDVLLLPVFTCPDPLRKRGNLLILCETFQYNKLPHPTNTRARLRRAAEHYSAHEPLFGMEQEYTLMKDGRPLGFPPGGYPEPQGGYYCGVGCDEVFGSELVELHRQACIDAGLRITGTNAEVMPGQWEFQIGPLPPLELADQIWVARWLLYRLGDRFDISATLQPKPVKGDWNGASGHMNFSTGAMMCSPDGIRVIYDVCEKLQKFHKQHISVYGHENEHRLSGRHETCAIDEFRFGVGDRGASIRIPHKVHKDKMGYLEDRRPAANADPYQVCTALLETVCGDGFTPTSD
ncbi:MAG: glutamine synthetase [Candidatus Harrisonbacteria bacterium CG10_big_fil_rev_8_21_14_0_10_42_17]|uniref:glutamine synthetase n=1 Tax=Candidatus Harrisonbacteria bacterium CG10_big_fil_rev_8_21_14_0_10_42_17 TaxID=1974584 RepID=A0A2M6WH14_9BACT|nr:MAG: glutamine synthetase [Candidatus Harrisonbacteria bacterium CG10_big_fil_rev_8_21_14_0_10_42_17]